MGNTAQSGFWEGEEKKGRKQERGKRVGGKRGDATTDEEQKLKRQMERERKLLNCLVILQILAAALPHHKQTQ